MPHRSRAGWIGLIVLGLVFSTCEDCQAQKERLSEEAVLSTMKSAQQALIKRQRDDGSWNSEGHVTGGTALVTLALLNSGMTPDDLPVRRALAFLRGSSPSMTYEVSLALMVYSLVKDPKDRVRMNGLVRQLEESQITRGKMKGCWDYNAPLGTGGDHSNGQFAVLGLFEAAMAGISVSRETWTAAREHWEESQCSDGGWSYGFGGNSGSGSMTVAGISVQVMTSAMLQEDKDLDADGNPECCAETKEDESLARALRWMANHFSVIRNPGGGGWKYYYLYGLERAGRLSGRRFFGENDWYRSGARHLISVHNKRTGLWDPSGNATNDITASSFALLFLSKGLAPVLINKLKYGEPKKAVGDVEEWNRQANDIRNLTARLSGADGWPKLMTWQVVDLATAAKQDSVADLNQAPVLYLTGSERPVFSSREVELLREFVNLGGFILAVNGCESVAFRDGIFELVEQLYPNGETSLQRLRAEHPVYRAEYLLHADITELWGAEFGCRTAIMYSPDDLGCLWHRWSPLARTIVPEPQKILRGRITLAMKVGANIITYATGREPVNKLRRQELAKKEDDTSTISRGLLQVAQVRHTGGWDTAPHAAQNLLRALNRSVGLMASTRPASALLSDSNLFDYSMLVMHGRHRFTTTAEEREKLREYLGRGRLLFADACCGSRQFDQAFRAFIEQLYPNQRLKRIPVDHEVFSDDALYDLRQVSRRVAFETTNAAIQGNVIRGEPFLEGIEVDGRLVVIYSKHDISCALERQASIACTGYVSDDAVKIAVNVLLYSLLRKGELTSQR